MRFEVTLQVFAAGGDVIEVEAESIEHARDLARYIARRRFDQLKIQCDLQEIVINDVKCLEERKWRPAYEVRTSHIRGYKIFVDRSAAQMSADKQNMLTGDGRWFVAPIEIDGHGGRRDGAED